jgi:competence protein ComEC
MASALDLIAAVGQTFGERPESVRALPRPPDLAFLLCVASMLWACLWRGVLRWAAAPIFAMAAALYVSASRPIAAFDADLRAAYAQGEDARWMLIAGGGRSTYARDRLGASLGLSPPQIERLAPPETCSESVCLWEHEGRRYALVRAAPGFEAACARGAVVIARAPAPQGYAERCAPAALMDAPDIARFGGALIHADDAGLRIERAWPSRVRRPWTQHGAAAAQE